MPHNHNFSVFTNSCIKVPVDPTSKMPKSAFERRQKSGLEQCSIDSSSTVISQSPVDVDAEKLKDFYQSIPDYDDINHLPPEEFNTTLKLLRERRKLMLGHAMDHIDNDINGHGNVPSETFQEKSEEIKVLPYAPTKKIKSKLNSTLRRRYSADKQDLVKDNKFSDAGCKENNTSPPVTNITGTSINRQQRQTHLNNKLENDFKITDVEHVEKSVLIKNETKSKRNHSACSISWNDRKVENRDEIDKKFDQYFERNDCSSCTKVADDDFKTRSMPSSPLRANRYGSPTRRRKSITIPKPFKMTERDEEDRVVNELRVIRKSLSDDMLHQKRDRRSFRARPVPIESRIPLYDKILEDQAMRRAITKINSEAELRAQMKPFNFTKREEKCLPGSPCRAVQNTPKPKKKKRFRARPVPKNLFSNYIYDKMKEDEFFRTFNRRIRAEEMLRNASLPGSMGTRDRSRLSTPAAHSDLPIDPSPLVPSVTSSDKQRMKSPSKQPKRREKRHDFITTSPQPFHLNTADRAAKKMEELTKKIYQESKSTASFGESGPTGNRTYSALELRAHAAGRSNLAALLRAEAVRHRFEMEATRRLAEQKRKMELKTRDRILRSNPAWHLVKNNHEEDIAMRLQTRRDEERMRREEFLHEMELMYGRVQQQPMLFERYYAPRLHASLLDSIDLSPRKQGSKRRSSRKNKSYHCNSPERSRKVSLNETGNMMHYLNKIENNEKLYSDSEALDSLDGK